MRAITRLALVLTLAAGLGVSWSVRAQDQTGQSDRRGGIEAITVTAEKREADLQDLGLSIQAFSAQDLERMSLTSTEDFGALVPGLTFNGSSQNPGQLSISPLPRP